MLCECGCGKDAGVYASSNSQGVYLRGQPKSILKAHKVKQSHCKHGHEKSPENCTPRGVCKLCNRRRGTKWRRDHPVERLAIARKHAYGLTNEQYQGMLAKQNNKCLCCSITFSEEQKVTIPCIDHDHACCSGSKSCGKCIRGIICYGCNVMLGFAKDSPEILQAAIKYLKETQKCPSI